MGSSHIVVDGSNIATEGRSLPSLQQLLDAVDAVKDDQKPDTVTVIVDATFGHRIDKAERERYDDLVSNGELITPPAGVIGRGDAFILEVADRADAVVLSNDSFQEFHGTHRWLFDEGRLLGGKHVPGVGWIFLDRNPVRGPASRKAVSEAKRKRAAPASRSKKSASKGPKQSAPSKKKAGSGSRSKKKSSSGGRATKASAKTQSRRGGGAKEPEQYNELLPFLEFLGAYEVGSVVQGEVEQFSSHGAYVLVGDTRCYIPMKAMGDPPPRSAREVLTQGEKRSFTVEAIDTPRRGIDLSLADGPVTPPPAEGEAEAEDVLAEEPVAETVAPSAPRITESDLEDPDLSVSQRRKLHRLYEAQLAADAEAAAAPKAEPAEKPPARRPRRSPAKKSSTRKKAPAKKASTKKATAKKSTTRKKAAPKKATAKTGAAKKSTKKAAPATRAKKSTTKTAPASRAKKTAANKTAAKKSTARKKAAPRKATTKKSTRARRTTKKSPPSSDS